MKLRKILPIFMALTSAATAHAEDRWYIKADFGIQSLGSQTLQYADTTVRESARIGFDVGLNSGATLGYRLTPNWRLEADLMYRTNELGDGILAAVGAFDEGNFASLGLGLSALYDFNLFGDSTLRAYAGAGPYFVQEADIDFERAGVETSFEADDIGFQLQLGLSYPVSDHLFIDVGLRALFLSDVELELPADTNRIISSDYDPVSLNVGFGYRW